MSELLFETTGGIATITLNRPDSGNAFTTEMLAAWEAALRECILDDAIRAVVLTGAGRIFCSGGDVKRMAKNSAGGQQPWDRRKYLTDHVHRIPLTLMELDKPYIVAVNGAATGAGMDMALMGDLRIAAESARFAETYIKVGFVAGDGGAWMLPRLIGQPKALEMLWTGDFVSAQEAERIGLVNRVVPDAGIDGRHPRPGRAPGQWPDRGDPADEAHGAAGRRQRFPQRAGLRRLLRRHRRQHRGPPRSDPRLRREAQARVHGPMTRRTLAGNPARPQDFPTI
ncbi:enoyl-CoA hydratase/isomerase family protein [Siccirubricoccus sp. G192]|nr:enoyl-CoA hydratase/isomerase family protein [Siccirubricoccus sp. G192]MBV1797305.1 enoyl-CoA hydratase/isomerase family protein [Siccirubricoccus sp. G192]